MARLQPAERRAALLKQQAEIAAQIRNLDAKEKKKARTEDTRRKIIAGGLILKHVEQNPTDMLSRKMRELLQDYVEPHSRYLFPTLISQSAPAEIPQQFEAAE